MTAPIPALSVKAQSEIPESPKESDKIAALRKKWVQNLPKPLIDLTLPVKIKPLGYY